MGYQRRIKELRKHLEYDQNLWAEVGKDAFEKGKILQYMDYASKLRSIADDMEQLAREIIE